MVTKYERQLERAEVAKRMRQRVETVHTVASRVPFWRLDDAGDEIVIRDLDGPPLVTFHGMYPAEMGALVRSERTHEPLAWPWPT